MKKIYRIINLVILFSILLSIKCFAVKYPSTLELYVHNVLVRPWNYEYKNQNLGFWCRQHGNRGGSLNSGRSYSLYAVGEKGKEMPEILAGWLYEVKDKIKNSKDTTLNNMELQKIIWHQKRG